VRLSLPKLAWFVVALGLSFGINQWRMHAAASGLEAAQAGDRQAAERWVTRALRESDCELFDAQEYLRDADTRSYVRRPDYIETFVRKLRDGGATAVEICESDKLGFRIAHYLLVTLPEDAAKHEQLISDSQSLVRRDAVVYRGVSTLEVEDLVRTSTLIGTTRVLIDLPAQAN
jgi:hypothetical protein